MKILKKQQYFLFFYQQNNYLNTERNFKKKLKNTLSLSIQFLITIIYKNYSQKGFLLTSW